MRAVSAINAAGFTLSMDIKADDAVTTCLKFGLAIQDRIALASRIGKSYPT